MTTTADEGTRTAPHGDLLAELPSPPYRPSPKFCAMCGTPIGRGPICLVAADGIAEVCVRCSEVVGDRLANETEYGLSSRRVLLNAETRLRPVGCP